MPKPIAVQLTRQNVKRQSLENCTSHCEYPYPWWQSHKWASNRILTPEKHRWQPQPRRQQVSLSLSWTRTSSGTAAASPNARTEGVRACSKSGLSQTSKTHTHLSQSISKFEDLAGTNTNAFATNTLSTCERASARSPRPATIVSFEIQLVFEHRPLQTMARNSVAQRTRNASTHKGDETFNAFASTVFSLAPACALDGAADSAHHFRNTWMIFNMAAVASPVVVVAVAAVRLTARCAMRSHRLRDPTHVSFMISCRRWF